MSTAETDRIELHFDETIKIENIVEAYDFGSLLVEVGSSLGLWLGLSVVGLFDVILNIFSGIKQLCNQRMP